jgi:hypothetical protein
MLIVTATIDLINNGNVDLSIRKDKRFWGRKASDQGKDNPRQKMTMQMMIDYINSKPRLGPVPGRDSCDD